MHLSSHITNWLGEPELSRLPVKSEINNPSKIIFTLLKAMKSSSLKADSPVTSKNQCDKLASYFVNKVENIYNSLPPVIANTVPVEKHWDSGFTAKKILSSFPPLSPIELESLCQKIKSGSPADSLKPDLFRQFHTIISPVGRELINLSLTSASLPSAWKHAKVIPLLKKPSLEPSEPGNYRPISQLPGLAKAVESHVNTILTEFIERNEILDPS